MPASRPITGIDLSTGAPYSALAWGDGTNDDTVVIQAALNACGLIKVPAGTQNGRTLRIRGKGVPYLRDQGRGDLLVRLKVSIPTDLSGEQRELFRRLADTFDDKVTPQENKGFFDKVKDLLG